MNKKQNTRAGLVKKKTPKNSNSIALSCRSFVISHPTVQWNLRLRKILRLVFAWDFVLLAIVNLKILSGRWKCSCVWRKLFETELVWNIWRLKNEIELRIFFCNDKKKIAPKRKYSCVWVVLNIVLLKQLQTSGLHVTLTIQDFLKGFIHFCFCSICLFRYANLFLSQNKCPAFRTHLASPVWEFSVLLYFGLIRNFCLFFDLFLHVNINDYHKNKYFRRETCTDNLRSFRIVTDLIFFNLDAP